MGTARLKSTNFMTLFIKFMKSLNSQGWTVAGLTSGPAVRPHGIRFAPKDTVGRTRIENTKKESANLKKNNQIKK